jgi:hypothetical protein
MSIIPKEETRRQLPTEQLQKELKKYIGSIIPYEPALERIIIEWGFNLPGWDDFNGTLYYGFYGTANGITKTTLMLNYVDALAEEVIYVCSNGLINHER